MLEVEIWKTVIGRKLRDDTPKKGKKRNIEKAEADDCKITNNCYRE